MLKPAILARVAPAAAAAMALFIAACTASAPPPPPPPPAVAPPVTLSVRIVADASAWRGYMARAKMISPAFTDGEGVSSALKVGAAYEPKQLLRGAVAYAAVIALQDPTFVSTVRGYAADPALRQQLIVELYANPNRASGFPGANSAAGLIVSTMGAESTQLLLTGRGVKQAAYDVQRSAWSKESVADRDARLILAKSASATPLLPDGTDIAALQQASVGAANLGLTGGPTTPTGPIVMRGLTVAALAALGAAGDDKVDSMSFLFTDQPSASCLNMAKLNLYQCLAVSKPHYEDVFCLGQHILIDTGQCMIKGVGAVMPPEPVRLVETKPTPVKKPAAKPAAKPKPKAK